jgi:hypothetical protein
VGEGRQGAVADSRSGKKGAVGGDKKKKVAKK